MTGATEPGRAASWETTCFVRERREFLLTAALGCVLFPLYYLHDFLLEPALLGTLVWIRIVGGAIWLSCLVGIQRAKTVVGARSWFLFAIATTGPMVSFILPRVEHYSAYLIGYSSYFWGTAGLSWPLRWTTTSLAWQIGSLVVASLLAPTSMSITNPVGTGLYLLVAGAFSAAACHSRRAAYHAAFDASFALAQRNTDLEVALLRIEEAQARLVAHEKMSALGRMLAGLSHELNNPVNVIKNNLDPVREHVAEMVAVLQLAHGSDVPDALSAAWQQRELDWRITDIDDALGSMSAAVEHMMHVHRDLRTFIRGDAPGLALADVSEGIRATVSLLARRTPAGVSVEVDLEPLPPITCQPGQLNQVWLNLLQNALEAVGTSGRVSVRGRAKQDKLEISVSDTGPGIDPRVRPRLFEPFSTTKPPGQGTGLGLAIGYDIIQRHGGSLHLDEGYRDGARFVVELPVAAAA